MKNDNSQSSFVNIGSSSLLIIFLILSLVTFAILSLSGARSDYSFSQKLAEHKTAYYEASNQAEQILGQIDDTLASCSESCVTIASYPDSVKKALAGQQYDSIRLETDGQLLTFSIPMEGEQALLVQLEITDYTKAETFYVIKTWQVISTKSWESDQSIQLLPMGE